MERQLFNLIVALKVKERELRFASNMRIDESLKEKCITLATVTAETDFDHVETIIVQELTTHRKEIEKLVPIQRANELHNC